MQNERYCGDVLARKIYTPNFKDHKSKKNKGKKNKYFQPDHHDAIVTRAIWNAAQRILNSRRYGHEGEYLPMRVIDRGVLTGFISMNRSWAGFEADDYFRVSQIAMGILDDNLEPDLENEYIPDGGHRPGGMIDDHGISRIARELTEAEQQIKDELEGKDSENGSLDEQAQMIKTYQVVSGDMFSKVFEPIFYIKKQMMPASDRMTHCLFVLFFYFFCFYDLSFFGFLYKQLQNLFLFFVTQITMITTILDNYDFFQTFFKL